jgi:methylated-DNA-[protein]-cysteine S-methyltransferase
MGRTAHHYLIFETPGGFCGIAWNSAGITRFQLPTRNAKATERILLRRVPGAEPGAPTPEVTKAVAAVKRYFKGEETDFSGFRLDLGEQDPFFERVYAAARQLGWGHTTTYGALAKELGAGPEAARDVGQAMARNPVALIIPCHRVLAAGGKVGGFSAPGGSAAKIRMLELEGVDVEPPRPAQRSFVF